MRRAVGLVVLALCFVSNVNVAVAGDKEDIVGRWDYAGWDSKYFRFYADGTFKEVAPLNTTSGTYRFLSEGVIELDQPGWFYGRI